MKRDRFTKIVATMGPATNTPEIIEKVLTTGVDVFRLNFSHGTHEEHKARYDTIRMLEKKLQRPISILADLQGPKLRIGKLAEDFVMLEPGQKFTLDRDDTPGDATRVFLPHQEIFDAMEPGSELLIFDGKIALRVDSVTADKMETTVILGGKLTSFKGVNVPHINLPFTALTEKDHKDLAYALELGVDWVALSFVQRTEDVEEARALIGDKAKIIVKLEKPNAVRDFDDILKTTDAVMVARGDLGVELPIENVPAIQKMVVKKCRAAGKPVIVATQMLDSMVKAPTPTRAEASDVATAVFDGVDAVMLSEESAAGDYPVESVQMMDRIIKRMESDELYRPLLSAFAPEAGGDSDPDAISAAARQSAASVNAACIVTYTTAGGTAFKAARQRPSVPILGISSNAQVASQLSLAWGVHPVHAEDARSFEEMVDIACDVCRTQGFGAAGQEIVITAGTPFGTPGATNVLRIAKISEAAAGEKKQAA